MSNFNMAGYNGPRIEGHDYTKPLAATVLDTMGVKAMTVKTIARMAKRERETVYRVINRLHKNGEVHIARWRRGNRGPITPCYKVGPGEDAKRLKPLTTKQKCQRYRNSEHGKAVITAHRKTEAFKEHHEAQAKAYYARKKFKTKGLAGIDPLMAAIYGRKTPDNNTQGT